MAISIDWGTKVIFVPKADLTLIQATPTEIRELNLNTFRLALKDLEDSDEGMAFPDTHRHNTEVMVAGLTLARVVEIINGYTVTFEDGQYAVNLPGANSNVGDVVNVNQVSVRTFNSAGLTSSPDIEFASYQNAVAVDIASAWAGTLHPVGTMQKPVNNMADAMLIAEHRGLKALKLLSSMNGSVDLSNFLTRGASRSVVLTMLPHTCQHGCTFEALTIIGQMCGQVCSFQDCSLINLSNVQGFLIGCTLAGTIKLTGTNVNIIDCVSGRTVDYGRTIIDMDGLQANLQIRRFSGGLVLKNFNAPDNRVVIDFAPGALEIDASCVAGTIVVHGEATIIDAGGVGLIRDFSAVVSPASVKAEVETSTLLAKQAEVKRALGLVQENFRLGSQEYDGDGNLESAILRIYGSAADAQNDVNPIAEYAMAASFSGPGQCTSYLMTRSA